ncbi:hypothetical protein UFOVP141_24 [uncultured Caudovirales phage]|uniref:Uncharacterized protein n=1 Tax=uncultured Caudovirales phage TaxID=2100421 RepID=A0A6J7VJW6_9CAUD|nr:hypothetical protein UFOVP141_24 [uncultured Caudovirales phage]
MPRIRTIKPEIWKHPVLSRIDDSARMAAVALLNFCDDEGYFLADPALVRSDIWPFDEDSSKARRVLTALSDVGWIEVRMHRTHGPIGVVVNFTKHQRIDRPSPSKIKDYFLDDHSTNVRRGLDERSLLDQGSGIREGIREQGGGATAAAPGGIVKIDQDSPEDDPVSVSQVDRQSVPPPPPRKDIIAWAAAHRRAHVPANERDSWDLDLRLYGWDALVDAYEHVAAETPAGKRVFQSAIRAWLGEHYALDAEDYERAGIPVPAQAGKGVRRGA